MDSPRGRIYQMVQVAEGAPITPSYIRHIDLCLACRGCESACPSGVPYGRMVEDARSEIEAHARPGWLVRLWRRFVFGHLLESGTTMTAVGTLLYLYQASGMKRLVRRHGPPQAAGPPGRAGNKSPRPRTHPSSSARSAGRFRPRGAAGTASRFLPGASPMSRSRG